QPTGQVEQVQGEHRQEALQVRLLVDGEVQAAALDRLQRYRGQVEAARRDLALQAVLLDHLANRLGRTGVHREDPLQGGLVGQQVGVDGGVLLRQGGARRLRGEVDVLAGGLDRLLGAVDPRLDVGRARGGDEADRVTAVRHAGHDPLPQGLPGQEQVLADVGEPVGARVADVAVRLVAHHGYAVAHAV